MFGELLGLAMLGTFVWVIDENGHRHKVRVKNEEHRKQLLAQNREMRKKLAAKGTRRKKTSGNFRKKTVRRVKKEKSIWDYK